MVAGREPATEAPAANPQPRMREEYRSRRVELHEQRQYRHKGHHERDADQCAGDVEASLEAKTPVRRQRSALDTRVIAPWPARTLPNNAVGKVEFGQRVLCVATGSVSPMQIVRPRQGQRKDRDSERVAPNATSGNDPSIRRGPDPPQYGRRRRRDVHAGGAGGAGGREILGAGANTGDEIVTHHMLKSHAGVAAGEVSPGNRPVISVSPPP